MTVTHYRDAKKGEDDFVFIEPKYKKDKKDSLSLVIEFIEPTLMENLLRELTRQGFHARVKR